MSSCLIVCMGLLAINEHINFTNIECQVQSDNEEGLPTECI